MLLCAHAQTSVSFEEAAGTTWAFRKCPVCIVWLAQVIWPDLSNTSIGGVLLVAVHLAAVYSFF